MSDREIGFRMDFETKVISFDEKKEVCRVNEALCKGCGACVGACPSDAISLNHFTNEQILAQMEGMLI